MMKLELVDITIIKVCRTLYGTRLGGISALCKPVFLGVVSPRWEGNASEEDFDSAEFQTNMCTTFSVTSGWNPVRH